MLSILFSDKPLSEDVSDGWAQPNIEFNLFVFIVIKFILEVIAISCPIPAGVFAPTFILGAGVGRLYGHFIHFMFGTHINPAVYSVIGAASVTASVTRTVSVAMILFELNGELTYMVPVLFAVLVSYGVSNSLSLSFFDVITDMKDLPNLPVLRSVEHYMLKAENMMNKNFLYLTKDSKLSDIAILLEHLGSKPRSIPVVESEEIKVLLFSVQAQSLRKYLFSYYNAVCSTFDRETREKLNKYFYTLYDISDSKDKYSSKLKNQLENEALAYLNFSKHSISIDDESKQYSHYFVLLLSYILTIVFISIHFLIGVLDLKGVALNKKESFLRLQEFNMKIRNRESYASMQDVTQFDDFWAIKINFDHNYLAVDRAPFIVMEDAYLSRVHFLFTMLNLSQVLVIRKGIIVGIITKNDFLKKKRLTLHQSTGSVHKSQNSETEMNLIPKYTVSPPDKNPNISPSFSRVESNK